MRTIVGSTKDKDEFGGAVARRRVGVGRIRPRLLAAPSERTGLTQAPRTCLLPAQSAGNTEGASEAYGKTWKTAQDSKATDGN